MNNINSSKWPRWIVIGLLASVAMIVTYDYVQRIDLPRILDRMQLHEQILNGTAESPYRYRLFAPYFTQLIRIVMSSITARNAFWPAYALYDFLAIFLSFSALFHYLRNWFNQSQSLFGVLFAAISITVGFRDHYFQPWSLLEPAIIAFGLHLLFRKHWTLLALVIFFGSFNRETTILLVIAYFLYIFPGKRLHRTWISNNMRVIGLGFIYLLIWFVVFIGLRLVLGGAESTESFLDRLAIDLRPESLALTLLNFSIYFGVYWICIFLGYKKAPVFVQKTTLIIPIYLAAIFIWLIWYEVRLLSTLYPIFIPLGLSYLFPYSPIPPVNPPIQLDQD